jgi:hypothetical protein
MLCDNTHSRDGDAMGSLRYKAAPLSPFAMRESFTFSFGAMAQRGMEQEQTEGTEKGRN